MSFLLDSFTGYNHIFPYIRYFNKTTFKIIYVKQRAAWELLLLVVVKCLVTKTEMPYFEPQRIFIGVADVEELS